MKKFFSKIFLACLISIISLFPIKPIEAEETTISNCDSNVSFNVLFRLYNPNTGEHFYTTNDATMDTSERASCIKAGWRPEDIAWTVPTSDNSNTPVYRLYNPNFGGDHHYTTDLNEYNAVQKAGWIGEGVAFYSDDNKGIPVYREYNPNAKSGMHNWTTNLQEHLKLIGLGWKDEGISFYAIDSGHDLYGYYQFHEFYTSQSYLLRWVKCKKCGYAQYVQYYYYKPNYKYALYLVNNYPFMNLDCYDITTWQEFLDATGF